MTVEEQATFTCRNTAGQIGVIETGYLYPLTAEDQRDFAFSISHTSSYIRGYADQLYIKARDQQQGRVRTVEYNTDEFYSVFLRRVDGVGGRLQLQVCAKQSMRSLSSRQDTVLQPTAAHRSRSRTVTT